MGGVPCVVVGALVIWDESMAEVLDSKSDLSAGNLIAYLGLA